ncbi:MAG: four helix bundle protein [Bacteroidales bacterium]|nr:four helix bundle protein [Bacteroidales bacterium]
MDLEELRVYQQTMALGEKVWNLVINWDWFAKDTIGKQLVKSVDSIAANLSEGFGRYHYRESKNFFYYSCGSLFETKTWITKAINRDLISVDDFSAFSNEIKDISVKLNNYIASVGKK